MRTAEFDRHISEWTVQTLHKSYRTFGVAVVRGAIPVAELKSVSDAIANIYNEKDVLHVYDADVVKSSGLSAYDLIKRQPFSSFLELVFAGQHFKREDATARRIRGAELNGDWQRPLELHLDSEIHGFGFTVNFWIPFEACGVESPSLRFVPVDYRATRHYSGYNGVKYREGEQWYKGYFSQGVFSEMSVKARFGADCFFNVMAEVGDVVVASNWLIHGTYATPRMTKGRTSVEVRYIGSALDIAEPQ